MRRLWWVPIALLLAGCAGGDAAQIALTGRTMDTSRNQISVLLDTLHTGIEQERIFQVLGGISGNYRDSTGRTQGTIREDLKKAFEQYRKIRITRTNPRLEVDGASAIALESLGVIAETGDAEQAGLNWFGEVKVWLEISEAGRWQIVRVEVTG